MPYTVRLINRAEREARIRAGVAASTGTQVFYDFRNKEIPLKVIRIEVGLLIYRMENFRTFIDQTEYAIKEQKSGTFFLSGQENESVQQLQHEILAKLARTGRADSVTPVIDVLKKEKQREPILITHGGVVVNGNRRLAAMRELYEENRTANAEFSHVNCMVLPEDTTAEEIVDIEANLQAKPETKLDYDWIGDCQLINKLLGMGRDASQIAERLRRKEKEIRNSIEALSEANMYLKDWAKAEGEYSRVRDGEQFFKDMPGLLVGKPVPLQEASRAIGWTLYDNRNGLDERLYAFNVAVGKRAADVLDRVSADLGVPLSEDTGRSEGADFDVEVDADADISYDPLIDVLRDSDRREEAVEVLIDACKGVLESERSQKTGTAALKAVAAAHAKLVEVDISRAAASTYASLGKQLDAIIAKAAELKDRLAKFETPAGD